MPDTLPSSRQQHLEQALSQWRHWHPAPPAKPELVHLFDAGLSNHSLRVSCAGADWVVRIERVSAEKLGLSRSAEWRCMHNAFEHGLCPRPVYQKPQIGCIVTEFVAHADDAAAADIPAIAQLFRQVHQLPAVKYRLDTLHRAQRYLAIVGAHDVPDRLLQACEALAEMTVTPVLCHNDLLAANRLKTDAGWLALDWEYAAMGDPFFDLAVCIEGDELNEEQSAALLSHYLMTEPSEQQQERLQLQRTVYTELSRLWEKAFEQLTNRDTISE